MKRGAPSHPKTYLLAEALGIRHVYAIGYLELLFHFTAQYAPRGDIGRFPDKRIAAALEWPGDPSKLIDCLVRTGWIDQDFKVRLLVHDWHQHADRTTLQRLSRMGESPIESNQEDTAKVCTQSETQNCTPPEPLPKPVSKANVSIAGDVDLYEWFCAEYPGEVAANLWQSFSRYVNTPEDGSLLRLNLPLWKQTKKYSEGYAPKAIYFLRDGVFKRSPPREMMAGRNGSVPVVIPMKPEPLPPEESERIWAAMRAEGKA